MKSCSIVGQLSFDWRPVDLYFTQFITDGKSVLLNEVLTCNLVLSLRRCRTITLPWLHSVV